MLPALRFVMVTLFAFIVPPLIRLADIVPDVMELADRLETVIREQSSVPPLI